MGRIAKPKAADAVGTKPLTSYFNRRTKSESRQDTFAEHDAEVEADAEEVAEEALDGSSTIGTRDKAKTWSDTLRLLRYRQRTMTFRRQDDGTLIQEPCQPDQLKIVETRCLRELSIGLFFNKSPQKDDNVQIASGARMPVEAVTTTQEIPENLSYPLTPLQQCELSAFRYIQLIKSDSWPFVKSPEVMDELKTHTDHELARDIVAGWQGEAVKLALYGDGWADVGSSLLPRADTYGKQCGLYFDFLNIPASDSASSHHKAYCGMASGVDGLYGRLRHHESATFRQTHPSLHYKVRDSPGTTSTYCAFAKYPPCRSRGFLLLAEGHQIAIFGLFEHPKFLHLVSTLGMPCVTQAPRQPLVGLNRDPGLQFQGWDNDGAEKARDAKDHQKALELITTGFPITIKQKQISGRQTIGQIQFMLFHNQAVNISADLQRCHPQIANHDIAIAYLDLSPKKPHHAPWYNCNQANKVLQRFGLWIQLEDNTGFWLQCLLPEKVTKGASSVRLAKWEVVAQMITEVYGLED